MSNKKKIYYRFTFSLASALSVGSGENQYSDSDIVRDSAGDPFIPGSSLAGIYRSMFENKEAEKYFGTALKEDKEAGSRILVYDAKLCKTGKEAFYRKTIRDCVGLDEWKTGKMGCKFDFEVIEPGAEFVTYLEQDWEENDRDIGQALAIAWKEERIRIGRKTMRGLGSIRDVTVCRRAFELTDQKELDTWLDFDMYCDQDWDDTEVGEDFWKEAKKGIAMPKTAISLKWQLRQRGGISIRRYTTQVSRGNIQPDAEHLTCIVEKDGKEIPYIPGTSWAGVFRHHMELLCPGCTEEYFGSCEKRSLVRFHESFIDKARPKVLTRNAVDRFTGGVVDNALFTEKMWYGGTTVLQIEIPAHADKRFKQALAASLADLHMGLLSIGGLTAVGRGVFEGEELLIGKESVVPGEGMYEEILKKLEGR